MPFMNGLVPWSSEESLERGEGDSSDEDPQEGRPMPCMNCLVVPQSRDDPF